MASIFSHAVAALSVGTCFYDPHIPKRVWAVGVLCSVVPDLDVIGFRFGVRYGDVWGHRGFTHSLAFATLTAVAATSILVLPRSLTSINRLSMWTYFFLAAASHGLFDAMTNGGLGVAFFAPFDNRRYFLPWTPILVSPIGVGRFFSDRGLDVFKGELLWIWFPAGLLAATAWVLRRNQWVDNR